MYSWCAVSGLYLDGRVNARGGPRSRPLVKPRLVQPYGGAAQLCPAWASIAITSVVIPMPPSGAPERHGWPG